MFYERPKQGTDGYKCPLLVLFWSRALEVACCFSKRGYQKQQAAAAQRGIIAAAAQANILQACIRVTSLM